MLARDVMTRAPAVVTPDEPIHHAAAIMRDRDVGFVPVVVDRLSMRLGGVVTDRDIAVRCVAEHLTPGHRVLDVMSMGDIETVGPETEVHTVLAVMERAQVRRLPVVDDAGRVIGVIAQADIARRLGPVEPEAVESLVAHISAPTSASHDIYSSPMLVPPVPLS